MRKETLTRTHSRLTLFLTFWIVVASPLVGQETTSPTSIPLTKKILENARAHAGADEYYNFARHLLIAETSDKTYHLGSLSDTVSAEELLEKLWPQTEPMAKFRVVEDGDNRSLVPWECSSNAETAIQLGEQAYAQRNYAGAATHYRQAIADDPNCYVAHTHLGDAILFGKKDAAVALEHYNTATKLNPLDYRTHFFRGSALIRLGQRDAAMAAWRQTLALRPNYPILRQIIDGNAQLGITMNGPFIKPLVQVEENSDGSIKVETAVPWMGYGLCRALWLAGDRASPPEDSAASAEPKVQETRKERKARRKREKQAKKIDRTSVERENEGRSFSTEMELECLLSQLETYASSQESGDNQPDPEQEQLLRFAEEGLLDEAITYDGLGRMAVIAIPLLPQETRDALLAFVTRYVLVEQ